MTASAIGTATRALGLAAVIQARPDAVIDTRALRTRLKELLPVDKVPKLILRTGRLPLTTAGKPDRAALKASVIGRDGALERLA